MSVAAIRAFGIAVLALDAFLLLAFNRLSLFNGPLPWRTVIGMSLYISFVTLVGVGLLFLRKWAAIVFALALVGFPVWMTVASIGEAPWGVYFMIAAADIVLVLPIIIVVRSWGLLSWRGKWLL